MLLIFAKSENKDKCPYCFKVAILRKSVIQDLLRRICIFGNQNPKLFLLEHLSLL